MCDVTMSATANFVFGQCDHWCQVLWKSVKGFRSYRTPPNAISYT